MLTRNKNQFLKYLPPTSLFFPSLISLLISLPPPPPGAVQGLGNGGSSQFITHCLCHSSLLRTTPHTLSLLQCCIPSTGDNPPQTSPTLVVPKGRSSSWTAPGWVLLLGLRSCQEPANFPQGHSPLGMGPSRGCRWISATVWSSMGCRGTAAWPWSSALAAGELQLWLLQYLLPLLLHSPKLLLSHVLTPHFYLLFCSSFFPHHNYVIPEVFPLPLMVSALATSRFN